MASPSCPGFNTHPSSRGAQELSWGYTDCPSDTLSTSFMSCVTLVQPPTLSDPPFSGAKWFENPSRVWLAGSLSLDQPGDLGQG